MLRKLLRLVHTIRYIKKVQLRYQLWYRLKNRFISIHWYKKYLNKNFVILDLEVGNLLQPNHRTYLGNNTFVFLGVSQSFNVSIDWNYTGYGKLWNYNLQYFAYLLDEEIPNEERHRLLKEFSLQLLSSHIHLEPYPVSLRVVNILLFHSRYRIDDPVILEALQKQIDYLANNLEYHLLANHLLENAFSLFIASIYLSDKPLFNKSYQLLVDQLEEQILKDGGHYESSPMYQSILLSKLFVCIEAARRTEWIKTEFVEHLVNKASIMLGWMNAYSFPDGSWALMNDAAEKIAPTTQSLNEAAAILNIQPSNVVLASSGYRKMSGKGWELIIKTGPVQPSHQPGHVHADISSYCLWYRGRQVIVDPGISTYAISPRRNLERGTPIHNTLSIAGLNQSDVWGGFRVGKRAQVSNTEDSENRIGILIHPFFNRSCLHQRTFIRLNDQSFVIEDRIEYPSSSTRASIGGIQFAENIPVQYSQNVIQLDDVTIQVRGIDTGGLKTTDYALTYHQFQAGLRFEYQGATSSSFTFQFR
jgi:hypothetical protein